ncbi:MAG: cyclic nucleotide-binding domain-containing protein [Acidobacteria bacterium]|nr:cyclic nucleotide-binding domain-containing protein [Acidobacteriota bacterium]
MSTAESSRISVETLRAVPLFASLDEASLAELRGLVKMGSLPLGTVLFRKGDAGDAMYLIDEGRVRIYILDAEGDEITLAEFGRGEFFGEMALIDGKPRTAHARVVDDARLAALGRSDFLRYVRQHPEVALAMVSVISERLRRTDDLLHRRVTRNLNEEEALRLTKADRIADSLANFFGGWRFLAVSGVVIFMWVLANVGLEAWWGKGNAPDPTPYDLLALLLGIIAGAQAPIILMSQNRQAEKERLRAENDYKVNLKNEIALEEVLHRLDALEAERLPELFALQRAQLAGGAAARDADTPPPAAGREP